MRKATFGGTNMFLSRNLVPPEVYNAVYDALKLNGTRSLSLPPLSPYRRQAHSTSVVRAKQNHSSPITFYNESCYLAPISLRVILGRSIWKQMLRIASSNSCRSFLRSTRFRWKYMDSASPSFGSRASKGCHLNFDLPNQGGIHPLKMAASVSSVGRQLRLGLSSRCRSMNLKLSMPSFDKGSRVNWSAKRTSWAAGGASFGACLSFSTFGAVHAESPVGNNNMNNDSKLTSHGKKVYTDYNITGIPGDGRCLFRSVAHGACIRSGKPSPDETLQRELADELRALVADEFIKRRSETEWFLEGDFDTYISQIRKPHVWGGEPELLMSSHVLQMPITVYMHDEESGGLITIAEYGQEYGKDNPIRVLYHGFGHYDALQVPGKKGGKSRL